MTSKKLENVLNEIQEIDKLCTPCIASAETYSDLLKDLYDSSVDILFRSRNKKLGPVTQFVIIGLDEESIWEELQTRNKPLLRYIKKVTLKLLKKLGNNEDKIRLDSINLSEETRRECLKYIESNFEHKDNESNMLIDDNNNDDDGNDDNNPNNEFDSEDNLDEVHIENDDDINAIDESENELDAMEAWLDEEEELEEKRNYMLENLQKKYEKNNNLEESDSEEENGLDDMLFVQENLYDVSESDTNEIDYRYNDFFANEGNSSTRKSNISNTKYFNKNEDIDERSSEEEDDNHIDDDYDDYDDVDIPNMNGYGEPKKSLLLTQISELEKDLVAPKSWELRGEVKASDRPENSFLSLSADIERTSKPAPVVTQEFTSSLEDMIRKRIKDGSFNDVKLKETVKPKEKNTEDVSQEKSKMGLGEIYAEEFLTKSLNSQPEVTSKRLESDRVELQNLFEKVSRQLDALSHFHFTPRPIVSDSKISSLPAIPSLLLEDITPSGFSNNSGIEQSLLAPEEVFNKKRGKAASLMSENELTTDDKKRIRKASKNANKVKKSNSSTIGELDRAKKDEKDLDNQLKRDNRVILADDSSKSMHGNSQKKIKAEHTGSISYSKSESFFANLQKLTVNKL